MWSKGNNIDQVLHTDTLTPWRKVQQADHYSTQRQIQGEGWGGCNAPPPWKFPNLSDSSWLSLFHHKSNSILLFYTQLLINWLSNPFLKKSWIRPWLHCCACNVPVSTSVKSVVNSSLDHLPEDCLVEKLQWVFLNLMFLLCQYARECHLQW